MTSDAAWTHLLRYAIGPCELGHLLIAVGPQGLRAVLLGDEHNALLSELSMRFSGETCREDDAGLRAWLSAVRAVVEGRSANLAVPLDLRGTPFQLKVWKVLQAVPAGETVTYAELARRLGPGGSARAVARACAANPLAVVIPCHRVVRSDGALSGYRWGVGRKRVLLEREAWAAVESNDREPALSSA